MSTPSPTLTRNQARKARQKRNQAQRREAVRTQQDATAAAARAARIDRLRDDFRTYERRADVIKAHLGNELSPRDIFQGERPDELVSDELEEQDAEAGEQPTMDDRELEHRPHGRPGGLDHGGPQQHDHDQEVDLAGGAS